MDKKLDIIRSNKESSIYITGDNLAYIDPNTKKEILINNLSNSNRPLCASELVGRLDSRFWHNSGNRIISGSGNLCIVDDHTEDFNYKLGIPNITNYTIEKNICDKNIDYTDILSFIEQYYNNKMIKDSHELTVFNSSKIVVNILDNQIIMDLVDKDEYTNSVSLKKYIDKSIKAGLSGKIDLSIEYSKEGNIFGKDFTFEAFNYEKLEDDNNPQLNIKNRTFNINSNEVIVEYLDGVIKVLPQSKSIDECIISNCLLTYGYI